MKLRLLIFLLWSCFLGSLGAQEVAAVQGDSLKTTTSAADSLATKDSLAVQTVRDTAVSNVVTLSDSLIPSGDSLFIDDISILEEELADTTSVEVEEEPLPENPALMAAWRRLYPFSEPSAEAMRNADTLQPSAIRLLVDSLPLDASLTYAQNDLRLPLVIGADVPRVQKPTLAQMAQRESEQVGMRMADAPLATNPYEKQLAYGAVREGAIYRYEMQNLSAVARVRPEHSDLPTERVRIERQELSADEQIDTGLGLELETASLNMEQVTFHADKWHRRGTTNVQISQTALSDNWYNGGDNNMTLSTYEKLTFSRYDEQKKTTLDIALELRLSGYYTKVDTIHPMRVNNDNQFRVDLSYGYKAWKNWYYSTSAYITTPIFELYKANSKRVENSFFAPLVFNTAVGMDLKLTKNKNFTYSLMLAPLSYNLKYVGDDRVAVTSYGISEGHRSLNQVGASITNKFEWKINESVAWTSRAYLFTSYHNFVFEFENTFDIKLGRYSSAKVYLYPRFDDAKDDKLQMKENLTFGLAFVW